MDLWEIMLKRRRKMQAPGFDLAGYCAEEKRLKSAVRAAWEPEEKRKRYGELRKHLGISELPER